jgi:hypothetical protein
MPKSGTRTALKGLGLALGVGLALGWVAVFLIPSARSLGLPEARAQKLPYVGFAIGAAWGMLAAVSKTLKDLLFAVVAVPVTGAVFYLFGLLLGGLLLVIGFSEETTDWVPPIAFVLGAAIGLLPFVALGWGSVSLFGFGRARQPSRAQEPEDGAAS